LSIAQQWLSTLEGEIIELQAWLREAIARVEEEVKAAVASSKSAR
jgi:hypothetical protein